MAEWHYPLGAQSFWSLISLMAQNEVGGRFWQGQTCQIFSPSQSDLLEAHAH